MVSILNEIKNRLKGVGRAGKSIVNRIINNLTEFERNKRKSNIEEAMKNRIIDPKKQKMISDKIKRGEAI